MDESKTSDRIEKECFQIIEFWRQGYSDREIREKLSLTPQMFHLRLKKIQEDDICGSESMMFFEKIAIKFNDLYKRALDELERADPRLIPSLIKTLVDIQKNYLDAAQRLGAVDPQKFVIEHTTKEREDIRNMDDETLVQNFQKQLNKPIPSMH